MPIHRAPICATTSVTLNAVFCAITSCTRRPFPCDNRSHYDRGGYRMEEEIRKAAIMEYLKGTSPKEICTNLQRSKRWFFKWLKRYKTGETEWYKERSRAPHAHPRQTPREERALIVGTRQKLEEHPFAQVGASAIKWELHKLGVSFPSDRTINRILTREGLTKKNCLCS